jgi:hypothetical protein
MLLSNITASPRSLTALLDLRVAVLLTPSSAGRFYPTQSRAGSCAPPVPYPAGDEINVPVLPLLVDAFVQGASIDPSVPLDKRPRKSALPFLASVFANLTTVPSTISYSPCPRLMMGVSHTPGGYSS